MKNYLFTSFFILFVSLTTIAQPERWKEKKDHVKSLKIAYITSELELTSDEASKFWPIFNEFEDKNINLKRDKMRSFMDRFESPERLSEKEASALLNQMENNEEEIHQLRKKFIASLRGVLPSVKILKLKKAEDEFSRKLLQQYRDKKVRR